jgi:hypothetical protein
MKVDTLFGEIDTEWWKPYWKDMPEFIMEDMEPAQKIIVSFEFLEDAKKFGELLGQKITPDTISLWYPPQERDSPSDYLYVTDDTLLL